MKLLTELKIQLRTQPLRWCEQYGAIDVLSEPEFATHGLEERRPLGVVAALHV